MGEKLISQTGTEKGQLLRICRINSTLVIASLKWDGKASTLPNKRVTKNISLNSKCVESRQQIIIADINEYEKLPSIFPYENRRFILTFTL